MVPAVRWVAALEDDKLVRIEEKLAHQEHALSAMNDALAQQEERIGKLEALCRSLVDRIRALTEAGPGEDGEQRPPHY